jgi:hypothetical protein
MSSTPQISWDSFNPENNIPLTPDGGWGDAGRPKGPVKQPGAPGGKGVSDNFKEREETGWVFCLSQSKCFLPLPHDSILLIQLTVSEHLDSIVTMKLARIWLALLCNAFMTGRGIPLELARQCCDPSFIDNDRDENLEITNCVLFDWFYRSHTKEFANVNGVDRSKDRIAFHRARLQVKAELPGPT